MFDLNMMFLFLTKAHVLIMYMKHNLLLLSYLPACAKWDGYLNMNIGCFVNVNMLLCGMKNFIIAFVLFFSSVKVPFS